jgi:hypothetical protein
MKDGERWDVLQHSKILLPFVLSLLGGFTQCTIRGIINERGKNGS